MDHFDLLVIGAGPAGSAAAATAARAGLRVALCDKAAFPRNKLCGGAFTGRAMTAFQRAFDQQAPQTPYLSRNTIGFYAFGTHLVDVPDAPALHMMMRHSLDAALRQRALDLGAIDLGQTGFEGLAEDGSVHLSNGPVQASAVIAADGVNSPVARALFGRAFDRSQIGFALEMELPGEADPAGVRIDLGAAQWGYGWRFPKTCGTTVGVGGVLSRNADMKAALQRYCGTLGIGQPPAPKGQFLPFGAFRQVPGRGRILLAGDAAGLVDPITGEGIAYALSSGRLAGDAVVAALAAGQPDRALAVYRRGLRPIHRNIRAANLLRRLLFAPRFQSVFVAGMKRSEVMRSAYLRLLDGQADYGPLLRQFAMRLPRYGVRSLGL